MYIIIVGNVIDGVELYGPFADVEEAQEYAESDRQIRHDEWHIVHLIAP